MTTTDLVLRGVAIVADLLIDEVKNYEKAKQRRRKKIWTRKWILRRDQLGASNNFIREVEVEDKDTFKNHLRLNSEQFEYLLEKVAPRIQKADTHLRKAIPARVKLQIVLRYLATGDCFRSLESHFRVPKCSISLFLPSVLDAIYDALQEFIQLSVSAEVPRIKLNNGREMPAIALGTFIGVAKDGKPKQENAVRDAVLTAIDLGYRHIDTAAIYGTEDEIGEAVRMKIKEGKITRGDVFITTKLWNTKHKREEVPQALRESLERLQTNYVDLYLIHWPFGLNNDYSFNEIDFMETWRGMEDAVRLGLARSIGLSNFNKDQVARVLREGSIKPAALQIEVHPQIAQSELVSFCHSEGIAVMGYSPFGSLVQRYGMFFPGPRMEDPVFVDIAKKYGKTPAQVVLRWQVDRNIVPIPKSVNPKRLQENFNIFDFKLTEDEIASISAFDSNTMLILPSFWQEHRYYPFKKIENPMPDPFRV